MDPNDMASYGSGPVILLDQGMTRHQFLDLCERAERALSTLHDSTQDESSFQLVPEAIIEGGIEWKMWPGKKPKMYKTIRLGVQHPSRWPWITGDDVVDEWRRGRDGMLLRGGKYQTVLKAFYGAPAWTRKELEVVVGCFREIGATIQLMDKVKLRAAVPQSPGSGTTFPHL